MYVAMLDNGSKHLCDVLLKTNIHILLFYPVNDIPVFYKQFRIDLGSWPSFTGA